MPERYLRLAYVVAAANQTAGKFFAGIILDAQDWILYPKAAYARPRRAAHGSLSRDAPVLHQRQVYEAGDEVEYDGFPADNLEPIDAAGQRR